MKRPNLVFVGDSLEKIPRQAKVKTSTYQVAGALPVIDQGKSYIAGYTDDIELRYDGPLPLTIFGDHTRILKWVDRPFAVGADGTQLLRGDQRFDQRYFYYALCSLEMEHFGYERHFKYLKEEQIPLPDLPTQRKIAGILSAYDDLIENNLRRIKILEQMAQSLYREWFVHFRFPRDPSEASAKAGGHESATFKDSELGRIPEGWEVKSIGDFGNILTGKTPSKANEDFYGQDVPFLKTPDMLGQMFILRTNEYLSTLGAQSQIKKTLPVGSICVSCIGTIGVVSITTEPCQTNQQINSVALHDETSREFLFFWLREAKQLLENLGSNGATMGNVNKSKFEGMKLVRPSNNKLAKFHKYAEPMFCQIEQLLRKIQTLRRTRDLLLPKLLLPTN